MRVTREQAEGNREKIVAAAARLFRENGFDGVGIDDIMAQAGLTHGGFYRHFGSKQDLATEAVAHALAVSAGRHQAQPSLDALLDAYLSPAHRDNTDGGCVFAALGSDIARGGAGPRRALTDALRARIARVSNWVKAGGAAARRRQAVTTVAAMVGALILARAVDDPDLSQEFLDATRASLAKLV
jgi:TetR/AcrR family transcriptional repressor of nem operon